MTFSLLPDCLAARLGGSLDEAEQAVVAVETEGVAATARDLRVEHSELPGVLRWLSRRRRGIRAALLALVSAMPSQLGAVPELRVLRGVLGTERALVALRGIAAGQLHLLPAPLGFCRLSIARAHRDGACQHTKGPDPPR
jgi:hypothetical protein